MGVPSRAEWVRWGFLETERAAQAAGWAEQRYPGSAEVLGRLCAATADPDQALSAYVDLAEVWDGGRPTPDDPGWVHLMALLGGSAGLGRWLRRRPADAEVLFASVDPWSAEAIRADVLRRADDGDELRWAYRRHLMRIAARDLTDADSSRDLETTSAELSNLNDAVVEAAVRLARGLVPGSEAVRLGVVALGKTGAREVNYVSDVDVLYVAEPQPGADQVSAEAALRVATQVAARITSICSSYTAAGTIWELDANLRPEGAAGPLVRTLAGMKSYYTTWAKNWEFQAMLKARAMAGDLALAQEFVDLVSPLVWAAAERDGFVTEAQAMRARVVSLLAPDEANREIKLSAGGLRDTEFAVQMLQLVHGRSDERLRVPSTLGALDQLVAHGYVGRADGAELDQAYRFQRVLEHRLQLYDLRRTHLMPADEPSLRRLARSVGLREAAEVEAAWRSSAMTVQRLHRRLYYSPLLDAVARIPTEAIRLTPEAAATRLKALGYADPVAALRHIEALTQGMTRRAEILRQLLPALLGWIAEGPNPDAGLLAFRQVAEALGTTPFFLRALRDEGQMAQNLARVLSASRYAASLLQRSPASVEILVGEGESHLPSGEQLTLEFSGVVSRYGREARTAEVIRATRRRELLRIAMADVLGYADEQAVGRQLSSLSSAGIGAALAWARSQIENSPEMAVIALGGWGGQEMSYVSDADVIVVLADSDDPDNVRKGAEVLRIVRQALKVSGPDPGLDIDLSLRPEGKNGPLVRTLSSYRAYYGKWSSVWEAQALIRARHGAGSKELSGHFLSVVDPIRYPADGLTPAQVIEIRRLKARMESERIGRGTDPRDHVKLGPGGLSDVEWTVQLVQLQNAWRVESLRVTGTLPALDAALDAGLVEEPDAQALREAYRLASRIRNAITLLRNRASDSLPADASTLGQVAEILGYARAHGSHLAEDWYRVARRARTVADRLFWG